MLVYVHVCICTVCALRMHTVIHTYVCICVCAVHGLVCCSVHIQVIEHFSNLYVTDNKPLAIPINIQILKEYVTKTFDIYNHNTLLYF